MKVPSGPEQLSMPIDTTGPATPAPRPLTPSEYRSLMGKWQRRREREKKAAHEVRPME
jgi:hypothetical protein